MSRVTETLGRIELARRYTTNLLTHVPDADWFRMPAEGVSHVAWQVGHLAIAEYRLCLERVRGRLGSDERFLPQVYLDQFGKGSSPNPSPAAYPTIAAIRAVFDAVHRQVLEETPRLSDAALDGPVLAPHPLFTDKQGALDWCALHEMLHAGQIGLLRRLFGGEPVR